MRLTPGRAARTGLMALLLVGAAAGAPGDEGCGFRSGGASGPLYPLAALPDGISRGQASCDGVVRPMAVWTLGVDRRAPDLGVRDRPLFRSRAANPLVPVAAAEVAGAGRLTLFKRREDHARGAAPEGAPDRRPPFRLFGTFCDLAAADPLDCAAGSARIKMRGDVIDSDGDGTLDRVRHQVSIWDGADRLQVLMFDAAHAGRPLGNAVPWLEALALAGRL